MSDYTLRYPELEVLRGLPAGTLVDGELVVLRAGRPDLAALLRRHQLVQAWRIGQAWRWCPMHYLLFDLLYHGGRSLLDEPCPFSAFLKDAAMIRLTCSSCAKTLRLKSEVAGRRIYCPHCRHLLKVPEATDLSSNVTLPRREPATLPPTLTRRGRCRSI